MPESQAILEAQMERLDDAFRDIKATVKCMQSESDPINQDACIMQNLEKNSRL